MTPMTEYDIEFYWQEQTVYWEGDRGFLFLGAWGIEPIMTFVPDAAGWAYLPDWLSNRRDLVLQRLRDCPDHVVVEDPEYALMWQRDPKFYASRELTKGQTDPKFRIADLGTNKVVRDKAIPRDPHSVFLPVEPPPPSRWRRWFHRDP
jgi:hypothetical protein